MITAKIIEDSISNENKRITTLQLMYPRFIHAELMTHRVFSRNASSSRAIPVKRMLAAVRNTPAMPIHWGKNQAGMQANGQLEGQDLIAAQELWFEAARMAANVAERMEALGLHKQVANRILEPFQHIHVVLTATEFDNWFELRAHPDAQPEIQDLAIQMRAVMEVSIPYLLRSDEWHLPYITDQEREDIQDWITLCKVSAARCCRVSYLKHDGTPSTIEEDLALCDRLIGSRPLHASPFEHQATPDVMKKGNQIKPAHWEQQQFHGNLVGWIQHRKLIEYSFS